MHILPICSHKFLNTDFFIYCFEIYSVGVVMGSCVVLHIEYLVRDALALRPAPCACALR